MIEFSSKDINQLDKLEVEKQTLLDQVKLIKNGIEPVKLAAPAIINNGIIRLDDNHLETYKNIFNELSKNIKTTRFVPASGAASRMFKSFFHYLEHGTEDDEIKAFAKSLTSFAFYDQIKCSQQTDYSCAINNMINVVKLAALPKALIPFHQYAEDYRTSFEEHLVEAVEIIGKDRTVNIHFTISEAHQTKFDQLVNEQLKKYESKYNCKFNLSFSYQSKTTDTVALNDVNDLFRNDNNEIVFRPGGHGSLLKNLNDLDSELVIIKNIDNVQPDHLRPNTILYKKVLAGYLIDLQKKVSEHLQQMDSNEFDLDEIIDSIQNDLLIRLPSNFASFDSNEQVDFMKKKLNRPLRICGMVKNEGEPGGGPFWVLKNEEESLQIVESSQIELDNPHQAEIVKESTHFNPVDLVCWIKDYQGNKFDLAKFTDPGTAFVTEKSQNGKRLKVLEHPGLWNGAMADWITLFVEVPISTFSPVKTITDLLRKEHQLP